MEIDLNCDLGEGSRFDEELMPLITSANVACGYHAGSPTLARATLTSAAKYGVRVGAHPSFPDRENFGRKETERPEYRVFLDCFQQIMTLATAGEELDWPVSYVKPHGALYNMACRDEAYARPVVAAAALFNLPLLGLPGSRLETVSATRTSFVAEGFADRRYQPDGSLVSRTRADAMVDDPEEAVRQVQTLIRQRGVRTICVHGDNPRAVAFVQALREALLRAGIAIKAFT